MSLVSRLDAALVERGMASGREKAKELIRIGVVMVNGRPAVKAAQTVTPEDTIVCTAPAPRYVGRGGEKLEKALEENMLRLDGCTALDVGASTGGFTDCMLQHGAAKVYAVDVGHGQLHPRLRDDPRVCCCEGMDIRDTEKIRKILPVSSVHFASIDVSFISVRQVLPAVWPLMKPNARVVCLIKPQFEAGRAAIGKNGLVRDIRVHQTVLRELYAWCRTQDCRVMWLAPSPITGGEGNVEYLALLTEDPTVAAPPIDTDAVAEQAFCTLQPSWLRAAGTLRRS